MIGIKSGGITQSRLGNIKTNEQIEARIPANAEHNKKVVDRINTASIKTADDLTGLRDDVAKFYGSEGIPQMVQQALNTVEKEFNDRPVAYRPANPGTPGTAGESFGETVRKLSAAVGSHEGNQASIDAVTSLLANADKLSPDQRATVKSNLVNGYGNAGVPQQVQQFLRTKWDGVF
jgi:hypothetical protein